jgi:predicted nucleotidyltransferase
LNSVAECYRGNGVRVFRLDRDGIITALRQRAERLVAERPEVLEVRLFGSLASGGAKPGSDADLWILLEPTRMPFLDRSASLVRWFSGLGVGCEVMAYTEHEWRVLAAEGRRIVEVVDTQGVALTTRRR